MKQTAAPGSTVWSCPVDGCTWTFTTDHLAMRGLPPIKFPTKATRADLGAAINEAARADAAHIDGLLREHLESHDVLDFVRTIHRLNCDLYQPHSGVRPHSDRVAWSQPDADPVRDMAAFMRLAEEREANTYGMGEVRSHGESDHPPA